MNCPEKKKTAESFFVGMVICEAISEKPDDNARNEEFVGYVSDDDPSLGGLFDEEFNEADDKKYSVISGVDATGDKKSCDSSEPIRISNLEIEDDDSSSEGSMPALISGADATRDNDSSNDP